MLLARCFVDVVCSQKITRARDPAPFFLSVHLRRFRQDMQAAGGKTRVILEDKVKVEAMAELIVTEGADIEENRKGTVDSDER